MAWRGWRVIVGSGWLSPHTIPYPYVENTNHYLYALDQDMHRQVDSEGLDVSCLLFLELLV